MIHRREHSENLVEGKFVARVSLNFAERLEHLQNPWLITRGLLPPRSGAQ